jgi:hypothetical protein
MISLHLHTWVEHFLTPVPSMPSAFHLLTPTVNTGSPQTAVSCARKAKVYGLRAAEICAQIDFGPGSLTTYESRLNFVDEPQFLHLKKRLLHTTKHGSETQVEPSKMASSLVTSAPRTRGRPDCSLQKGDESNHTYLQRAPITLCRRVLRSAAAAWAQRAGGWAADGAGAEGCKWVPGGAHRLL